jgi:hypothetical protein
MGGDNQHFEVFAVLDRHGVPKKWDCAIISKQDAAERVSGNRPVVNRDHGPGTRFEFTIAKNDVLEIGPPDRRRLVVVKLLTGEKRVGVVEADDARPVSPKVNLERYAVNSLMGELGCRKVAITPLGDLIPCRD